MTSSEDRHRLISTSGSSQHSIDVSSQSERAIDVTSQSEGGICDNPACLAEKSKQKKDYKKLAAKLQGYSTLSNLYQSKQAECDRICQENVTLKAVNSELRTRSSDPKEILLNSDVKQSQAKQNDHLSNELVDLRSLPGNQVERVSIFSDLNSDVRSRSELGETSSSVATGGTGGTGGTVEDTTGTSVNSSSVSNATPCSDNKAIQTIVTMASEHNIDQHFADLDAVTSSLATLIQNVIKPPIEDIRKYVGKKKVLIETLQSDNENIKLASSKTVEKLEQKILQFNTERREMVNQLSEMQKQLDEKVTHEGSMHETLLWSPMDDVEEQQKLKKQEKEIDAIRGEVSTWKMQEQQRQGDIETALQQSRTRAEAEAKSRKIAESEQQRLIEENIRKDTMIQKLRADVIQLRADLARFNRPASKRAHKQGPSEPQQLGQSDAVEQMHQQLRLYQRDYEDEKAERQNFERRYTEALQRLEKNEHLKRENEKLQREANDLIQRCELYEEQLSRVTRIQDGPLKKENADLKRKCDMLQDQISRIMLKYNPRSCNHGDEPGSSDEDIPVELLLPSLPGNTSSSPPTVSDTWPCSRCTYKNSTARVSCELCGKNKYASSGNWTCSYCQASNHESNVHCSLCAKLNTPDNNPSTSSDLKHHPREVCDGL